jgi:translation initiation factor IF-1
MGLISFQWIEIDVENRTIFYVILENSVHRKNKIKNKKKQVGNEFERVI